jgi:predicted metal-dependent hydrolase
MGDVSHPNFLQGIKLFNSASFFEAHEVLEDVWRESVGPEKKFLQALIQIAVGFHHHSCGNHRGARSLLARATRNLEPYPEVFASVRLAPLRKALQGWNQALAENGPLPPVFKIRLQARKSST